ncbi:DEAD/DEAH box helicase [Streptomyces cahuitamycinicus]|uniref:RNA helicase n=1 Tax=Streptomyces cahuitamycinicus TaxID=2070367 RepID=A0A2N8TII6_9ACTN|nr:DEAD/DEAH box helicase [Streptomyces cahuitamycinicus]PNG18808.1 DEAD/DEAH box helicase [Streptomyces cahuitamycinicus]
MTLPVALTGKDVIGQAKTGTGKTLGFGLPLLERVTVPADVEAGRAEPEDLTEAPQALVVVPTRELCTQVTNDLLTAGKVRNVRVLAIYGGRAYEPQVEALKKGIDVVVGTPGRLLDLAGQKKLNLKHVKSLVLDEADEMLDLGFLPDVEKIINMLPVRRQTMLFSATMPGAVIGLARRYMSQPTHISATSPDDAGATVANTKQFIYRAHNMDKPEMVSRILQAEGRGLVMVFCRTKRTAADLADQLKQRGFASGAVHGDLGQGAREQALRAFRNGKVDVLVCTDVAARGIDVEGVTHVINYQSPEEEKTYLHRIGRTGRAGAKGTAITLVDWDDIPRWQLINKALDLGFSDPPETYSTSPHFYTDLGIPEGTKGVLPRSERTRAGLDAEELEDLGETGGRGPRGRGGRGGGDRDESRSADRERSSRTPRRRRRTRGGSTVDGAPESAGTTAPDSTATGGAAEADAVTAPRTPRRRRRTRGGAQSEAAPVTAVESPGSEQAETAVATAEGTAAEAPETATKSRRRRTRRSETAAVETEAAVTPSAPEPVIVAEAPAAAEAALPEAAARPRRRTRKATAASAAESAVDTAEGTTESAAEPVETKPRRTRKTAAETEAIVDTAETAEAKPRRARKTAAAADSAETAEAKPRRTRKATAAAAEAAVDTAEGTEAKPRRRTRKTAEAPETTAEAAAPESSETKPRRTRKAAAPAEDAVDTAEGAEAKPRRRTRKATEPVAAVAEIPAQTAQEPETVEAKPRRTRKTAAAAPDREAVEAKPRRTRKTAAAAEAAVDTAEGTEAKPRRRTRKATEPVAAVAEIPAQADQEPEAAKPRRTRKATTATTSEDVAEAKPKARRTRKATAAAEPTEG